MFNVLTKVNLAEFLFRHIKCSQDARRHDANWRRCFLALFTLAAQLQRTFDKEEHFRPFLKAEIPNSGATQRSSQGERRTPCLDFFCESPWIGRALHAMRDVHTEALS